MTQEQKIEILIEAILRLYGNLIPNNRGVDVVNRRCR